MLQKFFISREDVKNRLRIREYAIIRKYPKNEMFPMQVKENFSLLVEEKYDDMNILRAINKGMNELISTIRTRNLFPNRIYATKIAEAVMALYGDGGDRSVELFFDDVDQIVKEV